jgi:hypothetical protein
MKTSEVAIIPHQKFLFPIIPHQKLWEIFGAELWQRHHFLFAELWQLQESLSEFWQLQESIAELWQLNDFSQFAELRENVAELW